MDLLDDKLTVFPRFLHCICSPERAMSICNQVNDLKDRWPNNCRPYIIWEPIPDSAVVCCFVYDQHVFKVLFKIA